MLQVKNLSKTFHSGGTLVKAVDSASFSINDGTFASVVGPSGSGKTTLLLILGTLEKPDTGSIEVDDQDVTRLRNHSLISYRARNVGFIFQSYNLVPNLTAIENVMLPMEFAGVPKGQRKERAKSLLDQVGITDDKQRRKPGRLSGGEQQRVAIARALANKPKIILADEPTGNLDSVNGKMIFDLLHKLAKQENTTVVVVTHDLSIAGGTDLMFKIQDGKLKTD